MRIHPNPRRSRCAVCGERPRLHDGMPDSDFFACECKSKVVLQGQVLATYNHVIYGGWDLPRVWRMDFWYGLRFRAIKLVAMLLKI